MPGWNYGLKPCGGLGMTPWDPQCGHAQIAHSTTWPLQLIAKLAEGQRWGMPHHAA